MQLERLELKLPIVVRPLQRREIAAQPPIALRQIQRVHLTFLSLKELEGQLVLLANQVLRITQKAGHDKSHGPCYDQGSPKPQQLVALAELGLLLLAGCFILEKPSFDETVETDAAYGPNHIYVPIVQIVDLHRHQQQHVHQHYEGPHLPLQLVLDVASVELDQRKEHTHMKERQRHKIMVVIKDELNRARLNRRVHVVPIESKWQTNIAANNIEVLVQPLHLDVLVFLGVSVQRETLVVEVRTAPNHKQCAVKVPQGHQQHRARVK